MPMPLLANANLDKDEWEVDTNSTLYHRNIGKLIYFTNNWLDLTYAVGVLNKYMNRPKKTHMEGAHHILMF